MATARRILIIGGGLAGSFMAARLAAAGQEVILADDADPAGASRVAAGLYNVITGRFAALTWQARRLLEELQACLAQPPFDAVQQYLYPGPIYRPFPDTVSYNKWTARTADPVYEGLVQLEETPIAPELIHNPVGGITILPCGWADIHALVTRVIQTAATRYGLTVLRETLGADQLDISRRVALTSQGECRFDALVLTEGYRGAAQPLLHGWPLIPNKGELLVVQPLEPVDLPCTLSGPVYVVPQPDGSWVVGATYENHFTDAHPSAAARAELLAGLGDLVRVPVSVRAHRAGIRPTTRDRRPICGVHPAYPFVYILTGLGTKGLLQTPYLSRLLTSQLLGEAVTIPREVSPERFR
ncbi:MAG: FAD-dependent oxidoreductase [Bacteroidia bacterium]|nr:FAD-dependent oxidoreductase [Bacteroidia bacterium]